MENPLQNKLTKGLYSTFYNPYILLYAGIIAVEDILAHSRCAKALSSCELRQDSGLYTAIRWVRQRGQYKSNRNSNNTKNPSQILTKKHATKKNIITYIPYHVLKNNT